MNGIMDIDIAIENAETDYPALAKLLGGYYHQDWRQDHVSPDAALQAFADDASPDSVAEAANDIDRLLGSGLDDGALGRVLADGFDCNYVPANDGITATAWLMGVRDTLRAEAS